MGKTTSSLRSLIVRYGSQVFVSKKLIDELLLKGANERFRPYFSYKEVLDLVDWLNSHAEMNEPRITIRASRDPKDDYLLSLALHSNCTILVTGDKDLLDIKDFSGVEIISFRDWVARLEGMNSVSS